MTVWGHLWLPVPRLRICMFKCWLITCIGTFFYLLEDTAHPCLSISEDGFTIFYGDEELPISAMALDDNTFTR